MLSNIKKKLIEVQKSSEYRDWFTKNSSGYLCSIFCLEKEEDDWQLDFYSPKSKLITNFSIKNENIVYSTDKVFSKTKQKINELKIENVKVDLDKVMDKINVLMSDKYKGETPQKQIFILQNYKGLVWNITFIMTSFNILNVKINAVNGRIMDDKMSSVFSFAD